MKLNDAIYATEEERQNLFKELNISALLIHQCSTVVIRKDDINYIIKDRWRNPYDIDENNIKAIIDNRVFNIISKSLLTMLLNRITYSDLLDLGDNLIIEI